MCAQTLHDHNAVPPNRLPGAGELITGPTVLGEAMAAGNLSCASPPYLIRTTVEDVMLLQSFAFAKWDNV